MPKAAKSKGKHADFQKTKLKLGKGKQQANNATDTSFRSRTIALPQQSINKDNSTRLVTSRNLGVTELAQQLRHFGAGVRKEAVNGIREILSLHPILIRTAVGQLIPDICKVLSDDDPAVRRNLYSLLGWYLPQIPPNLLAPYLNALLLFTASALSHIYPEVRIDAIKILDVLVQIAPHATTTGWQNAIDAFIRPPPPSFASCPSGPSSGPASTANTAAAAAADGHSTTHGERFMNCYLNLLGITRRTGAFGPSSHSGKAQSTQQRTSSTTITDLAPAAKLLILKSLRNFLAAAASPAAPTTSSTAAEAASASRSAVTTASAAPTQDCPTWFFRPSFRDDAEFETFEGLMRPDLRRRCNRNFVRVDSGHSASSAAAEPLTDGENNASASKRQKRRHDATALADASTLPDFLSIGLGPGCLINVGDTAGRSWATGDLFASLMKAALAPSDLPPRLGQRPVGGTDATPDATISPSLHLFSLLQPVMVATFLDSAPSAFRPGMDLQALSSASRSAASHQNAGLPVQAEIVSHLVALCITLWRASIARSPTSSGDVASPIASSRAHRSELAGLLGHASPYFPFSQHGSPAAGSLVATLSQKARAMLTEMDLAFCELTALLALSMGPDGRAAEAKAHAGGGSSHSKSRAKINLAVQLATVSDFISQLLKSAPTSSGGAEAANIVSLSGSNSIGSAPLDPTTYESLLPTVWLLLNTGSTAAPPAASIAGETDEVESDRVSSDLFEAVVEHYSRSGSSSKVKALAFEFIARLCTLQTFASYDASRDGSRFTIRPGSNRLRDAMGRWILGLPRYLWEATSSLSSSPTSLQTTGAATTSAPHKVLELLRYLVVVSSPSSNTTGLRLTAKELESLRRKLVPFFCVEHPVKKVNVEGPFARLRTAEEIREATSLVEWLSSGDAGRTQHETGSVDAAGVRLAALLRC
ncbi:uncharacterized protein PFL1_03397 [Pseudozyma flocculosa PF-1]|uniref:Pre-rRNA-processing protein n=2 Tax=Pseudozyma flocculosa TaxID=84751 RepID=A0A5C3F6W3_9BASI|nr:uncharacterized protein PFL1_03397 [Pseudozyma flocculosa PF-1]EPQ29108.1 hypothetical protein PFL1_03397 [Pseudozyma flocculosa PF-1]SPO40102.1 uncharacterized protein PSFLO_05584 [Pseudozyma flocculosa]